MGLCCSENKGGGNQENLVNRNENEEKKFEMINKI